MCWVLLCVLCVGRKFQFLGGAECRLGCPSWRAGGLVLKSWVLVHPFRILGTLPCQEGAAGATEGLFGASQLQN